MFMSVDLPAPFSPSSAWISPARTSRSMPSLAMTPGYRLVMPRISSSGGPAPLSDAGCRSVEVLTQVTRCRICDERANRIDRPARPLRQLTLSRSGAGIRFAGVAEAGWLAGIEIPSGHLRERIVEETLRLVVDEVGKLVERRQADALVVGTVEDVAAPRLTTTGRHDGVGDGLGQLLLGAGDDALGAVRGGQPLVDVDADAVDARLLDRLQHAVTGLAGNLEHHVDVLILLKQLIGKGLARRRVVEGHRKVVADVLQVDRDVRIDALRAILVPTHVVHDRRDGAGTADRGDLARLADAGRHDAGQVARLGLVEDEALVVVDRIVGLELVHADEVDVRVLRRRGEGRLTQCEADRHDDVEVLVNEGLDVAGVFARLSGDHA